MFTSIVLLTFISLSTAQSFVCNIEENAARYQEDPRQCDKYWDCGYDPPKENLCRDGLVFDPYSSKNELCDHYFNVDCDKRTELQPAQGLDDFCPRLNGFYSHPNSSECTIFYSCTDGVKTETICPPTLWFNEYTGTCDWPANTLRTDCNHGHHLCPGPQSAREKELNILEDPNPRYADPADCADFFICLNRIKLRKQTCELGLVYNEQTNQCDAPENVDECKCYYNTVSDTNSNPECGTQVSKSRK